MQKDAQVLQLAADVIPVLETRDAHFIEGVDDVLNFDVVVAVGEVLARLHVFGGLEGQLGALDEARAPLPVLGVGRVEDVERVPRVVGELVRPLVEDLRDERALLEPADRPIDR